MNLLKRKERSRDIIAGCATKVMNGRKGSETHVPFASVAPVSTELAGAETLVLDLSLDSGTS